MAGNGPNPNPNAKRRNARVGMVVLPPEGRSGPTPSWPLVPNKDDELAEAELELWSELWSLPQAVEWERLNVHRVVAVYARFQTMAEFGHLNASTEARQYSDRLGVTPRAMRGLMWSIGSDVRAVEKPTTPSSARTLKLVPKSA